MPDDSKSRMVGVLQEGEAKSRPYVIAFVANPCILSESGQLAPDPVLQKQARYDAVVRAALDNLFNSTEDLLRLNQFDQRARIVSIFDPSAPATASNALVSEYPKTNITQPRREVLRSFLAAYSVTADIVFAIHGSATHQRASAWYTTDDPANTQVSYTLDGIARRHGCFCRIPGSAAIPLNVSKTSLTVFHEFCHAASDFNNGMVADLYTDGFPQGSGLTINKKQRPSGGGIPPVFGTLNGGTYASDPSRDGLHYPPGWTTYYAELIDKSRPNSMDDYTQVSNPRSCRLDKLTRDWLTQRLLAKLNR